MENRNILLIFASSNQYDMGKTYTVTDIIYDTDGEHIDLPKTLEVHVPEYVEPWDVEEYISDEISNITGFCHQGFSTTPEINLED